MILPKDVWKSRAKFRQTENNNSGVLVAGTFRARETDFYVILDARECACSHDRGDLTVPYSSKIQDCPRSDDPDNDCCNIYKQMREVLKSG